MKRLFLALCLFGSFAAQAQSLTPAQAVTLKTAALADPVVANYVNNAQDQLLADWLNTPQPTFWVWRSILTSDQARTAIMSAISQLDNLTVSKRDSLLWAFSVDTKPSDHSVPTAIDSLTGSQNQLKTALQDAIRRTATRAEKILATGTGTNAIPATMTFEGSFSAALASVVRGS